MAGGIWQEAGFMQQEAGGMWQETCGRRQEAGGMWYVAGGILKEACGKRQEACGRRHADHPYYMLSSDCSLVPHHVFHIDDRGWPGGLQLDLEDQRCHLYTSQDDQDAQDDTLPGRPQA